MELNALLLFASGKPKTHFLPQFQITNNYSSTAELGNLHPVSFLLEQVYLLSFQKEGSYFNNPSQFGRKKYKTFELITINFVWVSTMFWFLRKIFYLFNTDQGKKTILIASHIAMPIWTSCFHLHQILQKETHLFFLSQSVRSWILLIQRYNCLSIFWLFSQGICVFTDNSEANSRFHSCLDTSISICLR